MTSLSRLLIISPKANVKRRGNKEYQLKVFSVSCRVVCCHVVYGRSCIITGKFNTVETRNFTSHNSRDKDLRHAFADYNSWVYFSMYFISIVHYSIGDIIRVYLYYSNCMSSLDSNILRMCGLEQIRIVVSIVYIVFLATKMSRLSRFTHKKEPWPSWGVSARLILVAATRLMMGYCHPKLVNCENIHQISNFRW